MTTALKWERPQEIDAVTAAFPARVAGTLLPDYSDIPDEFKRASNPWVKLVSRWFFSGLSGGRFVPKDGIDTGHALRHLSACMRSFEPKHEHKEAGVAYLASLWFDRYEDGAA